MSSALLIFLYVLLGASLMTSLLIDRHTNTCWSDKVACVVAGLLWPLFIVVAICSITRDRIEEKRYIEKALRKQRLILFSFNLMKMGIISKDTHVKVQRELDAQ